jgi:hypothetical protein
LGGRASRLSRIDEWHGQYVQRPLMANVGVQRRDQFGFEQIDNARKLAIEAGRQNDGQGELKGKVIRACRQDVAVRRG